MLKSLLKYCASCRHFISLGHGPPNFTVTDQTSYCGLVRWPSVDRRQVEGKIA